MNANSRFGLLVLVSALLSVWCFAVASGRPVLGLVGTLVGAGSLLMGRPAGRSTVTLLVVAATLHAAWGLLQDRSELISHMAVYLCLILMLKILDRASPRDEAQLLALSVFVVIGAVLTGQSFLLGLVLLGYTPVTITAVVLLQMHTGWAHDAARRERLEPARPAPEPDPRLGAALGRTIGAGVGLSMLVGAGVFVITPRGLVQQFIGSIGQVALGTSVGYREQIRLGDGGFINEDNSPVMDITVLDPGATRPEGVPVAALYLRGSVLTHYDRKDHQWLAAPPPDDTGRTGKPQYASVPPDGRVRRGDSARTLIRQEITIRNAQTSSGPLFAAWRPTHVRLAHPLHAEEHPLTGLLRYSGGGGRVSYSVDSALDWRAQDPPVRHTGPLFDDGPIRTLALRVARESQWPDDPEDRLAGNVRRLCQVLIQNLRERCVYSLDNPAPEPGEDPIEMFITRTRRGHCEYFASAMCAVLQSLDIDARIVTGYVAAEINPLSGLYVVRQSDAHAWVEVRLESDRWETFDPTPPGELRSAQRASSGPVSRLRQLWEALEFHWIDRVVAFDRNAQMDLLGLTRTSGTTLRSVSDAVRSLSQRLGLGAPPGLVVLGGFMLIGLVIWPAGRVWRRVRIWLARSRSGRDDRPDPDAAFYRRFLLALERRGVPKPGTAPPLTHAGALPEALEHLRAPAQRLAWAYYALRFGRRTLSTQTRVQIEHDLSALEDRAR